LKVHYFDYPYLHEIHDLIETRLNFSTELGNLSSYEFLLYKFIVRLSPTFYENRGPYYFGVPHYIIMFDHVFLEPKPAPYTYLEKALLPFDDEVWFESQSSDVELGVSLILHHEASML
jgi:hypothetical protein